MKDSKEYWYKEENTGIPKLNLVQFMDDTIAAINRIEEHLGLNKTPEDKLRDMMDKAAKAYGIPEADVKSAKEFLFGDGKA